MASSPDRTEVDPGGPTLAVLADRYRDLVGGRAPQAVLVTGSGGHVEDPIEFIEDLLGSAWLSDWRFYEVEHEHFNYRVLEHSARTARGRCRINYDYKWYCPECRPYKEKREGRRIRRAFGESMVPVGEIDEFAEARLGIEMWVTVIPSEARDGLSKAASKLDVKYVAIPTAAGYFIVLTTGPLDSSSSRRIDPNIGFVQEKVMPLRWVGRRLAGSRGFLPPDREFDFYEVYRPETRDRCWHLHESEEEAYECRDDIAKETGTGVGWYVRGRSEWAACGIVRHDGDLRDLLDKAGLMSHVREVRDPLGDRQTRYEFGPVVWSDFRFESFRQLAGWSPPKRGREPWQPPATKLTYVIDVDTGRLAANG